MNKQEYTLALAEAEGLMHQDESKCDFDRLKSLAARINAYESENFPIEPPSISAIMQYELEKRGLP